MALEIFRLIGSVFVDTDKANKSLSKVDKDAEGFGKTLLRGVGTAAKWAAGVAVAAGAVGVAIGTAAVKSYAEYEQLVGGIETLFDKSADTVMKYANNAYKTAGMTANQYMETATSFAAALLAGLGGNTAEAARITDMAITDMSDNANKMGSDLESLRTAYQGFAKGQFMLLDNLKLGYGGTKTEMQRLLKEADAINKKQGKITKYSIDNLNDIYEAIHVVQTEMGITGTTAKEATSTISGQIGMLKARFENFKNTLGATLAPAVKNILAKVIDNLPTIESLVSGVATTAVKVVEWAMPYIEQALEFIEKWFSKVPEITKKVGDKLAEVGGYMSQQFQPVLQTIRDWFDKLKDSATNIPEKLQALKDKAVEVGDYIVTSFQPTIDNLKKIFEDVKDKLQPFIDKLTEYVKSGAAAEDATNFLRESGELLKEAFDLVAEAAAWVTEKIIEISDWCTEHYKTIENIAIVVGSFATAWGLVNGALAVWNGLCTVGAVVTGALSSAASVLAGVWAFLTAPITLVIAAIAAVIAIGVLLWRNWDTIKAKCAEFGSAIKEKFDQIKTAVVNKVTELKDAAVSKFNDLKSNISLAVSNAKQTVVDTFKGIYDSVSDKVTSIYNKVKEKFDNIKTAISDAINTAKDTVQGVIEKIKSLFDFEFKLNLKLPHLKVEGGEAPWGIGGKGKLPTFDIQWYKDAYDRAMILSDPTIFGQANGKLLGGGDGNGNEVVAGEAHLLNMIGKVVAAQTAAQNNQIVDALFSILDAITGGNEDLLQAVRAGHTIKIGEREFARAVRTYA